MTGVPDGAGAAGVRNGEVRYTIVLAPDGSRSLVRDSTTEADVTLVEDWSTAEAIASGEASVPEMLTAGRIKLRRRHARARLGGDFLAGIAPLVTAASGPSGHPRTDSST